MASSSGNLFDRYYFNFIVKSAHSNKVNRKVLCIHPYRCVIFVADIPATCKNLDEILMSILFQLINFQALKPCCYSLLFGRKSKRQQINHIH
jgi:hypothetical protein